MLKSVTLSRLLNVKQQIKASAKVTKSTNTSEVSYFTQKITVNMTDCDFKELREGMFLGQAQSP